MRKIAVSRSWWHSCSVPGVDPSALGDQLLIEDFPINESPFRYEGGNLIIETATVNSRTPVTLNPV